ncbi:hypothetical protein EVAR_59254_1 [Eumeta japonica]|uniref:Uncharacterized protein n=1 Tax=Eumeta variegata TaxID=151549 RepID=A0A4C1YMH7_EUMVA|nr:hypothetical protein EVAR_59254_1 [Eumeta japonica]
MSFEQRCQGQYNENMMGDYILLYESTRRERDDDQFAKVSARHSPADGGAISCSNCRLSQRARRSLGTKTPVPSAPADARNRRADSGYRAAGR